jgi:hypothetical protein
VALDSYLATSSLIREELLRHVGWQWTCRLRFHERLPRGLCDPNLSTKNVVFRHGNPPYAVNANLSNQDAAARKLFEQLRRRTPAHGHLEILGRRLGRLAQGQRRRGLVGSDQSTEIKPVGKVDSS